MKHIVKKDDLRTEVKQGMVHGDLDTIRNIRDTLDALFGDYIDLTFDFDDHDPLLANLYMKVNYVEPDEMTQAIEKLVELSEKMEHNRNARFIEEYRRLHGKI